MSGHAMIGRRTFTLWIAGVSGSVMLGCSTEEESEAPEGAVTREPVTLPALTSYALTTERTIVPTHAMVYELDAKRSPIDPDGRAILLSEGFGAFSFGAGEAIVSRTADGAAAPSAGGNAKRLARFAFMTDIHVMDDESPLRMEAFDGGHPTDGAGRPQGAHQARVLNAAVRTINAINADEPVDFVLLGGDVTDTAQKNEMTWLVKTLSGGTITPDSGIINDPVPGSDNDPKDPFVAPGLDMPWFFCMGNHDALVMGIGAITATSLQTATGDYSDMGVRDWTQPGAPVLIGEIEPDQDREPLKRGPLLALVAGDGDGHGLKNLTVDGYACYVLDIDGTDLRFIVYDTACEEGGPDGIVRKSLVDSFLRPALDDAKASGKQVVLASHHPLRSIGEGMGAAKADAMPVEEVKALFLSYDNVILSLAGHTHEHVVEWQSDGATGGFWEVQTASLIEFPGQMRLVEITDEDNGFISIQMVGVDYATDGDSVAEEARTFAVLDHTSGWGAGSAGAKEDRNVKLFIPKGGAA